MCTSSSSWQELELPVMHLFFAQVPAQNVLDSLAPVLKDSKETKRCADELLSSAHEF
jgi:hypothetical protein